MSGMVEYAWPVDVISPTWYKIADESGAVNSIAWKSYVDEAHARGFKVWPLVDDFTNGLDRATLLMSTKSRDAFVSYMIAQANELGFDGINLDFELVPYEAASGFEQLLRELSVACRAHGLVFSIDNYPPRAHTEHYNRGLQGEVADYVIIMGYDEHWGTSSVAGSVSSLPFVVDAIEQTLAVVPAHKTINAVPFYTRIWSTSHADRSVKVEKTVGQKAQDEWIEKRGLKPIWSEELGQNYTQIDENNKTYQIWLENEASMQARIDAMSEYGLGGVACWRLGLENPEIWDILGAYTRG
jgi:spore germination protein YaaH